MTWPTFAVNMVATVLAKHFGLLTRCPLVGSPQRIAKKGRYGAFLMDNLDHVERMVTDIATGLKVGTASVQYAGQHDCKAKT